MRRPTEGLHLVFPPPAGGGVGGACARQIYLTRSFRPRLAIRLRTATSGVQCGELNKNDIFVQLQYHGLN